MEEEQIVVKSKRGRKPKNANVNTDTTSHVPVQENNDPSLQKVPGKRGRKPKGGKIIANQIISFDVPIKKHNVILHLKCSRKDLTNDICNDSIKPFTDYNMDGYETLNNNSNNLLNAENSTFTNISSSKNEINNKLKKLENNLFINKSIGDKTPDCFWCTYSFDSHPIYIPYEYNNDKYKVYGCFCSPECATGYLFDEHLDTSILFERYNLLNHLYGKFFNYSKNIKPAPKPHYILDKFSGNLSISEYRSMLTFGKLHLVLNKPLAPILPDIHEDNDELLLHDKIIPSN
tara:strand:+ start:2431 stop:3297 length:867 start_codon:yes stop_codon:yes gene_type:complete